MEKLKPRRDFAVYAVAAVIFFNGALALSRPLAERLVGRFGQLIAPVDFDDFNRTLAVFLGFTLIYFAFKLLERKQVAWWTALFASTLILIIHLFFVRSIIESIAPAAGIALLLVTRSQFRVRSEVENIRQGLGLLAVSVVVALVYGTIGFYILEKRDFGIDFTLINAAVHSLRQYALIGNSDLVAHSRQARWFLRSLDLLGGISVGFAVYSLFRPLAHRFATVPAERAEVERLLEDWGTTFDDYFLYWPDDKSYFFGTGHQSVIAYRVENGVAIVLTRPIGPPMRLRETIDAFVQFCTTSGWLVAFIYVTAEDAALFDHLDWRRFKAAEDAVVNLDHFAGEAATNKSFRNIRNRSIREGYQFEIDRPPHAAGTIQAVKHISDEWLKFSNHTERGFALGYFHRGYINSMPLYLVRDTNGKIVAFANGIPAYKSGVATVDLMRYSHLAPKSVMDFLFMSLMEQLNKDGWQWFSLGGVPLAGIGEGEGSTPEERLLGYVYRSGDRLFSFQGLKQFKDKFEPEWRERFVIYNGGPQNLLQIGLAMQKALRVHHTI